MWTIYGERFSDSDFSGTPRVYQPFTLERSLKLKALRTWFAFYNNPSFTTLRMRIYEGAGGVPAVQLAEFETQWALADILSANYGAKELYFSFTNPLWLRKGTTYYLVPYIAGSALTSSAHVAWVKAFPDPCTTVSAELSVAKMQSIPFRMALIGADFG